MVNRTTDDYAFAAVGLFDDDVRGAAEHQRLVRGLGPGLGLDLPP